MNKSFDRYSNMKPNIEGTTMKKQATKIVKQPDFILLTPLEPSYFGYDNGEVTRMISELELLGIKVLMADTGKELMLYARSSRKETLEQLCTAYDIGGILVEVAAVYDQVMIPELV